MKRRAVLAALAVVWGFAAASAEAQVAAPQGQTRGWYLGAEAGWSYLKGFNDRNSQDRLRFHSSLSDGFVGGVDGGYDLGRLRLEGEVSFRRQTVKSLVVANGGTNFPALTGVGGSPGGNVATTAIMANALFDFLPHSRFTPYIGAGVGGAQIALDGFQVAGTKFANSSDIEFAYQGIAGIKFQATPHVALTVDYRYFATTDPKLKDVKGGRFTIPYASHNVLLGLVYNFGAPPPPPPPVAPAPIPAVVAPLPAPPPTAQLFLVYFDFDKAVVTPAGERVIEAAVQTFKQSGVSQIDITGYTDLAGTVQYNLGLSKRRADAVRAYLRRLGVPDGAIVEAWRGKENPRVPTPDGVREAQNRRVEIVLP